MEYNSDIHMRSVNKEDKDDLWKKYRNWTIRCRVIDVWRLSKSFLWISSSWQLCQNLRCHCGQLSIGYVQIVSLFFSFSLNVIFPGVYFLVCHWYIISATFLKKMRIIVPPNSFPLWHHRCWRSCHLEDVHNKDLLKLKKKNP